MTSTNTDPAPNHPATRRPAIAPATHPFDTRELDYCPFMPVFGAPKLMIERGRGTEVWDTDGKRYLDFLSGIAVVSLGHANPVVAAAIAQQAETLLHVSNFFANPVATSAAIKINNLLRDAPAMTARSSSPTRVPSRTSAPSSWRGNGVAAVGTRWSAPWEVSTDARWPRSRRLVNRASTSRSSRCRRASSTSRGATSTRCGPPSTRRSRQS